MFYYLLSVRGARAIHSRNSLPFPVVLDTVHTWVPIEIPWSVVRRLRAWRHSQLQFKLFCQWCQKWWRRVTEVFALRCCCSLSTSSAWLALVEVGLNKQTNKQTTNKKLFFKIKAYQQTWVEVVQNCVTCMCCCNLSKCSGVCYRCCLRCVWCSNI